MLDVSRLFGVPMFTYETGMLLAFMLWIFNSVMLVVQLNSRMENNLNRVGQRLSWLTMRPKMMASSDLKSSVLKKVLKYGFLASLGLIGIFFSWISVAVTAVSFAYKWSKDYGTPQNIKEFRWKLRNMDLSFDQMVQEMIKLDTEGHSTLEQYKEALQRDLVSRGLMHHRVLEQWESGLA